GEVDGLNLFRMVRNNPVSLIDPNGKYSVGDIILTAIKQPDKYFTKKTTKFLEKRGVSVAGIQRWNRVRRVLMLGLSIGGLLAGGVAAAGVSLAVMGGVFAAGFVIGGAVGWFANKISDKFAGWMAKKAEGKSVSVQAAAGGGVAGLSAAIHNASTQGALVAGVVGSSSGAAGAIFSNTEAGMAGANSAGSAVGTVDTLSGGRAHLPTQLGAAIGGSIGGWVLGTWEGSADVGEAAGIGAHRYGNMGRKLDIWANRQVQFAAMGFVRNIALPILSPRIANLVSTLLDTANRIIPQAIMDRFKTLLARQAPGGHAEFAAAMLGGTVGGTYHAIDIRSGGEATRVNEAFNTAWQTTTFNRFRTAFTHYFSSASNSDSYA
ncbi:TPA: hypothetical protein ACGTDK_004673, partial [Salmonella enterica]